MHIQFYMFSRFAPELRKAFLAIAIHIRHRSVEREVIASCIVVVVDYL